MVIACSTHVFNLRVAARPHHSSVCPHICIQVLMLLAGMSFTMEFDLTVDDPSLQFEPTPPATSSVSAPDVVDRSASGPANVATPPAVVGTSVWIALLLPLSLSLSLSFFLSFFLVHVVHHSISFATLVIRCDSSGASVHTFYAHLNFVQGP